MTIQTIMHDAHETAKEKGWWTEERPFTEQIALMHSELSEALEDYRKGKAYNETYYEGQKPCGIATELADTIIRICDTCEHYGIDLDRAISAKMLYNKSRAFRHGGKIA